MTFESMSDDGKNLLIDMAIGLTRGGDFEISEEIRNAANTMSPGDALNVAADGLRRLSEKNPPAESSA